MATTDVSDVVRDPKTIETLPVDGCLLVLAALGSVTSQVVSRFVMLQARPPEPKPAPRERWLTVPEVAKRLQFAPSYIYGLARRKDLPSLRKGKYVRVREADLAIWEDRLITDPLRPALR